MRYLIPTLLFLAACAHKVPAPKVPVAASADDCNKVYNNLLTIAVQNSDQHFTQDELPAARTVLDLMWRVEGKSEKFFTSCMATANTDQTSCMATATSFEGLSTCAKLFDAPRHKN
jgi:hypothetical protein